MVLPLGKYGNRVMTISSTFEGRHVFITGHTGFKGSWLCHLLSILGAKITGFSLEPEQKSHFNSSGTEHLVNHIIGDIRNLDALSRALDVSNADIVIHLAAQPLVGFSYKAPVETFHTNVIGTANVLQAVRESSSGATVAVVTSDKCYKNSGGRLSFREDDPLGGCDPYSASKAATEMTVASFASSFYSKESNRCVALRGGNVIGGGDWGKGRLMPDLVEAMQMEVSPVIRNPQHERPWQFVLDALTGYLAAIQYVESQSLGKFEEFNIGPHDENSCDVNSLALLAQRNWSDNLPPISKPFSDGFYEAEHLALNISKALRMLNWEPRLNLQQSVHKTIEWYKHEFHGENMREITVSQIKSYLEMAETK
jgi:CDP-glucose 4,6-dehydratase